MQLLIVEDHLPLAQNVQGYLAVEGWKSVVATRGNEGLQHALTGAFACIILDVNLPEVDGLTICKEVRKAGLDTPIIMLTARTGTDHIIAGLDTGADDYLEKPFELSELTARIRALVRRGASEKSPVIELGQIKIDTNRHIVSKGGKEVVLAPKEYALLVFLAQHRGRAQERVRILEQVWDDDPELVFSQTVDVHISYLRKKLGKDLITTIPNVGYLIP